MRSRRFGSRKYNSGKNFNFPANGKRVKYDDVYFPGAKLMLTLQTY